MSSSFATLMPAVTLAMFAPLEPIRALESFRLDAVSHSLDATMLTRSTCFSMMSTWQTRRSRTTSTCPIYDDLSDEMKSDDCQSSRRGAVTSAMPMPGGKATPAVSEYEDDDSVYDFAATVLCRRDVRIRLTTGVSWKLLRSWLG